MYKFTENLQNLTVKKQSTKSKAVHDYKRKHDGTFVSGSCGCVPLHHSYTHSFIQVHLLYQQLPREASFEILREILPRRLYLRENTRLFSQLVSDSEEADVTLD